MRCPVSVNFSIYLDPLLNSVDFAIWEKKKYEITIYTSCYNTRTGVQYYNCYDNHQISKVDMHKENLEGCTLMRYPLITNEQIHEQN